MKMSSQLDHVANAIARWPAFRRAGSSVTSRLKRWSSDVAISGFPKCGNTWYGVMLRHLIVERFGLTDVPFNRLFVSDLGPIPLALRLPRGIPRLYHSHFMPFPERRDLAGVRESLAPFADKPMIVLIRDCKDVLVSYHVMEVRRFGHSDAPRDAAAFVFDGAYGVEKFVGYYNVIAEMRRRSAARTIVTSYEALLRDPVGILARDAAFIGADGLEREALARIVETYSFANMRRMELAATAATALVPGLHRIDGAPPDANFVRKGGSGNWRDSLSTEIGEQIDDYVARHLEPEFRDYAVSHPAVAAGA